MAGDAPAIRLPQCTGDAAWLSEFNALQRELLG
jgi:hypothetical protein